MEKPSKELIQDFKDHYVWRYIKECIDKKQEECKENLLYAKTFEQVQKIQTQHDTYKSILNLVNKP